MLVITTPPEVPNPAGEGTKTGGPAWAACGGRARIRPISARRFVTAGPFVSSRGGVERGGASSAFSCSADWGVGGTGARYSMETVATSGATRVLVPVGDSTRTVGSAGGGVCGSGVGGNESWDTLSVTATASTVGFFGGTS